MLDTSFEKQSIDLQRWNFQQDLSYLSKLERETKNYIEKKKYLLNTNEQGRTSNSILTSVGSSWERSDQNIKLH